MTKLEKLYSIIENSREVGVKLRKKKRDGSRHPGTTGTGTLFIII